MADNDLLHAYTGAYFSTLKKISTLVSQPMQAYHLSFEQYQIIADISKDPNISLTAIVKKRGVTKPAVARQIRVLRQLGYVTQESAPTDRRQNILKLTPEGQRVEKIVTEQANDLFNGWVNALGKEKAQQFLSLLNEVGEKIINTEE